MVKRIIILIAAILTVPFVLIQTKGQQPSAYAVKRLSLNTDNFNEISPVIIKDGIVFCSDKRFSIIKDRTSFDGRRLYNIYLAEKTDSSGWTPPEEIKSERNFLFNNGPASIAPDGKTVFFTSEIETGEPAKKKSFRNHSGIFIAKLSGSRLDSLQPFPFNSPDYDLGQPCVSNDGNFLYFASNMPGGQGGSDLYYCENINGAWAAPVNLGPRINTSGTENFPYFHQSGRLFFASDRSGGIGKLDIYYTSRTYGQWDDPIILPEPLNSVSDDFSLVADAGLQAGYFSSNRDRSDDIYSFVSTIIRKVSCDPSSENSYCYRFMEENAAKADTMPFLYIWRFGDGDQDTGVIVEHCYTGPGTYVVQLDVANLVTNEVAYNEKSDTLEVTKIVQAYISSPDSVSTGERIMLSADETYLPGWKIALYYWNFGDETIGVGNRTDKAFLKPGTYNVQLIVSTAPDDSGAVREACVSKNIIVMSKP